MTAEEKSVLSLFMIGVLIVVGKVLAGGEPITPRLFIGRMLLGGFVSMVAGVVLVQFPDLLRIFMKGDHSITSIEIG
ncbi:holin [Escherichia coli]